MSDTNFFMMVFRLSGADQKPYLELSGDIPGIGLGETLVVLRPGRPDLELGGLGKEQVVADGLLQAYVTGDITVLIPGVVAVVDL